MAKPQSDCTWFEDIFQQNRKNFQTIIITGFDFKTISSMCLIIDDFVEKIDLSFFNQYYKSNKTIGGRPNYNYKGIFKIYLYSLYYNISIRNINKFYVIGSELHYLSQDISKCPNRNMFTTLLQILDKYIGDIFEQSLDYLKKHVDLDTKSLYGDGTIFEAHNNRHKIITDTNIERSNKKWNKVLKDNFSSEEQKELARKKLELNNIRTKKLEQLNRSSYGRTDEDSVILKDKGGAFIAGYNVQYIEEGNHGLIIYAYISNKNPDSKAFLDIVEDLIEKYHPENITLDAGYGTPGILDILNRNEINCAVKAIKNENVNKKITDYSFELSELDNYLVCPKGQILEFSKVRENNKVTFKALNCDDCDIKKECLGKSKVKRVTIDLEEFKVFKTVNKFVNSEDGKELYLHRGNKCESPHGFIHYNLKGKKLMMNGLIRNNTIVKLYAILYNLRRMISIKSNQKKN